MYVLWILIPFVIRMDQNDQTGIEKTLNPKSLVLRLKTKLDLGPVIIKPTSANHTPSYMQGHGICFSELWVGGHSTTRLPKWNWLCIRLVSFGKGMQIRFLVGTVSGVAYMKVIRFEKIKVVIHDPVDIKQPSKQTMFMPSFQLMRPRVASTGWRRSARHGCGSIGVLP